MKLQARHGLTYIRSKGHVWYDGQIIEVEDEAEIKEYRIAGFTPVDDEGKPLDLPPVVSRVEVADSANAGIADEDGFFSTDSLNQDTTVSRVMTTQTPRRSNR